MSRIELFLALQDFGLSGDATKVLVNTGEYDAPFGELKLVEDKLIIYRRTGEVAVYDLTAK